MQLSLPASLPVSADPLPPGGTTAASATGQADVPFENLLSDETPANTPATDKVGEEAETAAASILASAFWMAVGPLPPPTLPAAELGDLAAAIDKTAPGICAKSDPNDTARPGAASLFAPRSSRAFAAIAAANPKGNPLTGNGPAVTISIPPAPLAPAALTGDAATAAQDASQAALSGGLDESAETDLVVPAELQTVTPATNPVSSRRTTPVTGGRKGETDPTATTEGADGAVVEITLAGARSDAARTGAISAGRPGSPANAAAQENIAAVPRYAAANPSAKNLPDKKDFLNAGQTAVTARGDGVGISVAQQAASMSPNPSNRHKSAQSPELVPVMSVSVGQLPASGASADAPAPTTTAHEVIAKVVSAVEALVSKEIAGQKSVDLQFRVGDESLALRVELRDGIVHTTFRAQSAELRNALAQEWQSVVQPAGREIRIADPVFSSSHANGESAFGSFGHGTPHQRGHAPESSPAGFAREFAGVSTSETAPAAPVASAAPGSASLLNTFA